MSLLLRRRGLLGSIPAPLSFVEEVQAEPSLITHNRMQDHAGERLAGAGNLWDASGNGFYPTIRGSGLLHRQPGPGGSLPYAIEQASTGYVDLASFTAGSASTLEWVFYTPSVINSTNPYRVLVRASTSYAWFGPVSGDIADEVFTLYTSTANMTYWTGFSISAGWHHLVITKGATAGSQDLYLDGSFISRSVRGSGSSFPEAAAYSLGYDGSVRNTGWRWATFARYTDVLAADRIAAHAAALTVGTPAFDPHYRSLTTVNVKLGSPDYSLGGCTIAPNGDVLVGVRKGPNHDVGGDIDLFRSTDDGATWDGGTIIRDTAEDLRDVALATVGSNVICTFTKRTSGSDFTPWAMTSTDSGATWGSPVAVTNGFAGWSFVSARIIELPNGDLLCPMYGVDASTEYARLSRSTDGGATWSAYATIVAEGMSGRAWQEPTITRDPTSGLIFCALRSDTGTPGIYLASSSDDGATWSAPTRLFDGSGRPSIFWTADDLLVVMYRHTSAASGVAAVRFSPDSGASWSPAITLGSSSVFTYGDFLDLSPSVLGLSWSVEVASGTAHTYWSTLTYDTVQ